MDVLYEKYENIQKFITKYRQYKLVDQFIDFNTFKKSMQVEQYIKHTCMDEKRGFNVFILIFHEHSKYIKTTPQFKRLLDKLPDNPADLIIITKNELSIYINKALVKYPHLTVHNYLHKYFAIELEKGPLCSKHTILTNAEVKNLCANELMIHPLSLASIPINDPQNIWIGGTLGQVIKITSISEITGLTIRYRIVSPDSGKMINIQNMRDKIKGHNDAQDDAQDTEEKNTEDKNNDEDYADDVSDDDDDDSD